LDNPWFSTDAFGGILELSLEMTQIETAKVTQLKAFMPNCYLNNGIEQDHRGIKQRYRPTCGLKTFDTASRFCRLFDEICAFLRPQSHRNQFLTLAQRRRIHRKQFARMMRMIAAA
jgi:transposase-like protein